MKNWILLIFPILLTFYSQKSASSEWLQNIERKVQAGNALDCSTSAKTEFTGTHLACIEALVDIRNAISTISLESTLIERKQPLLLLLERSNNTKSILSAPAAKLGIIDALSQLYYNGYELKGRQELLEYSRPFVQSENPMERHSAILILGFMGNETDLSTITRLLKSTKGSDQSFYIDALVYLAKYYCVDFDTLAQHVNKKEQRKYLNNLLANSNGNLRDGC